MEDGKEVVLRSVGALDIDKGRGFGKVLLSWDVVDECDEEVCPCSSICGFVKGGKCLVQGNYLKNVMGVVFKEHGDRMREDLLMRFGLQVVPLYKMLCKLKMEEVAVKRIVLMNDKGNFVIHPLFREIRDVIRCIDTAWMSLGLGGRSSGSGDVGVDLGEEDVDKRGYYERMELGGIPIVGGEVFASSSSDSSSSSEEDEEEDSSSKRMRNRKGLDAECSDVVDGVLEEKTAKGWRHNHFSHRGVREAKDRKMGKEIEERIRKRKKKNIIIGRKGVRSDGT